MLLIYHRSLRDDRVKIKFVSDEFLVHLVNLHTFSIYRGDLDVYIWRTQLVFGHSSTSEEPCLLAKHVFILAAFASQWCCCDFPVDPPKKADRASEKVWHRKALFICESIIMLWISIIHLLVLKLTIYHKIALRFQSFEQKLFLSPASYGSAGKCLTLCISLVSFYESWVMAGKYKREQRSWFDVHKRLW